MLNVYCDETGHLEYVLDDVMAIGGIYLSEMYTREVLRKIKDIKARYNVPNSQEIKWTKVSPGKVEYYRELINFFFREDTLWFRAVIIPDKKQLSHEKYEQTHDDFYYKIYYHVLNWIAQKDKLNVYIDIKDTRGRKKISELKRILNTQSGNINKIQEIRSHENNILQLADLLLGAIAYYNKMCKTDNFIGSSAKMELAKLVHMQLGERGATKTSYYAERKANIMIFKGDKNGL